MICKDCLLCNTHPEYDDMTCSISDEKIYEETTEQRTDYRGRQCPINDKRIAKLQEQIDG